MENALAKKLAGIARSAYYKWLKWKPSSRELENLALAKEVKRRYDKRKGILGYRQMRIQLNRKLKDAIFGNYPNLMQLYDGLVRESDLVFVTR